MYSSSEEIAKELQTLRDKHYFSERLIAIIDSMLNGIYKRHKNDSIVYEDFYQDCWIILMRKHDKIDLTKNVFAWLSTVFINHIRMMKRKPGVILEFGHDATFCAAESVLLAKHETTSVKTRKLKPIPDD